MCEYALRCCAWPNVEGNRPADKMRAEDQSMNRRVRLTDVLGAAFSPDSLLGR